VNAFIARSECDRLIEHAESEDGEGHEELYVVLFGEVIFEFVDERIEAGTGTVVAGTPGEPDVVSGWDRRWTEGLPTTES
jgi:hypothetical protein